MTKCKECGSELILLDTVKMSELEDIKDICGCVNCNKIGEEQ